MDTTKSTKLSLFYPAKPYIVTQKWGIYNPAYERFGFKFHNGEDFAVDKDGIVRAMCNGIVTDTGNIPTGAGIYLRYKTGLVEAEDKECYVEFVYMHAEKLLVNKGDVVKAGDPLIVADNTGYSTGPHTHISGLRIGLNGERLDTEGKNRDANYSFDFSKYFNGKYADDIVKTKSYYFDTNLKRGDEGEEVTYLQQFLADKGYLTQSDVVGFYGPKTQKAVYRLQVDYQIPLGLDWIYMGRYFGKKTRLVLNELFM